MIYTVLCTLLLSNIYTIYQKRWGSAALADTETTLFTFKWSESGPYFPKHSWEFSVISHTLHTTTPEHVCNQQSHAIWYYYFTHICKGSFTDLTLNTSWQLNRVKRHSNRFHSKQYLKERESYIQQSLRREKARLGWGHCAIMSCNDTSQSLKWISQYHDSTFFSCR